MHDYVCFIAPIDNCVELSLVDEIFCENLLLKWFQLKFLWGNVFLRGELHEMMQKIQILKILRAPSIRNQGVFL